MPLHAQPSFLQVRVPHIIQIPRALGHPCQSSHSTEPTHQLQLLVAKPVSTVREGLRMLVAEDAAA